jgi:large subunit ribosomal protein L24
MVGLERVTIINARYQERLIKHTIRRHTLDRPWTDAYWQHNPAFQKKKKDVPPVVLPIKDEDWMWFRGDRVEVLVGPDKGKQGYINMIVQERNWVTVEGLNCKYKVMGESPDWAGMMYKEEQPLLVTTDILLVDPSDEKGSAVEWRYSADGQKFRVSTRSGTVLPLPAKSEETMDYKTRVGYQPNKIKDTVARDVEDITYEPKLATFEMDIMNSMGIKEERKAAKSWWY